MKKYANNLREAKKMYLDHTGHEYGKAHEHLTPIKIFKLKRGKNKGKYFVGSYFEYLNLP